MRVTGSRRSLNTFGATSGGVRLYNKSSDAASKTTAASDNTIIAQLLRLLGDSDLFAVLISAEAFGFMVGGSDGARVLFKAESGCGFCKRSSVS